MQRWSPEVIRYLHTAADRSHYYTDLARELGAFLHPEDRVCDAGCGLGLLSRALLPYCGHVTAIDRSPAAIADLTARGHDPRLTALTGDIRDLPPQRPYDAMVFCLFGGTDEILDIAARQCGGTALVVRRDFRQHQFSSGIRMAGHTAADMEQELRRRGHELVDFEDSADAYIINTCSVTAVSDKKSRQMIRRARRRSPGAVVAACGCYVQTHTNEAKTLGIDLIGGTGDRMAFLDLLTMNTRPKNPANARNLNFCGIGSSGSGKTRFWLTPQLLQAHSSYVVVDPKGGVLGQVGSFLQKRGYKIKVFNSIDFSKSMHYNPLAYIKTEADILKFVNALISNTKGEGKEGDPFWTKAETLLYCALLGYIIFEGAEEDRNMNTLVDMISGMEVKEDDEDFLNAVDYMFKGLEQRKPNCFAVKQYKKYKLSSGDICSK